MPDGWRAVWTDMNQTYSAGIREFSSDPHYLEVHNWKQVKTLAVVYEDAPAADMEQLYLLRSASQYARFVARGVGDAYVGHTCYIYTWMMGTTVRFHRVVQGNQYGNTCEGWDSLLDVNGESSPSISLGTDLSAPHYLRVRIAGRRLSMRAWAMGEAEPTNWTKEAVDDSAEALWDPGYFGIATFTNYRSLIRSVAWAVDNATAELPAPPSPPALPAPPALPPAPPSHPLPPLAPPPPPLLLL